MKQLEEPRALAAIENESMMNAASARGSVKNNDSE